MLETGTELGRGRYRITGEIAKGGMATVYRALDGDRKEACAIKLLRPREGEDDQVRRRFHREAATMTQLDHPNIVRVYDTGHTDIGPFLVMEYAEGGSAWDWVKQHGAMPPRLAVKVMREVLVALAYAHTQSIVHRDVKPQNVLFDWMGHPKLSDFGVARITDGSAFQTTTSGTILGTFHYLAPEIREDARQATAVSDIYASAGCLYALVMGRHPRELHGADAFPDVLEGVPKLLLPIIKKATRFEQADRYQSAEEFREALAAVAQQLPETADRIASLGPGTQPPVPGVVRPPPKAQPMPIEENVPAALTAVALVGVGLLAVIAFAATV